ncbi:hypothetical protein Kpol_1031p44 [Vanderwaltozyma polyspora DSM 70294]|uniref:Protein YIP4 n=1 Tax=Vanderwaltozyma polyspora (strain ATCC 22028 / DSM 70294 / BCRC 21397 / CBS 2163 / NBRC 10782 / NRRL Y-8283 / UCD 57-17) TaxID=436907 RepID=A7THX6_VANPO|nr:uncharacterized protein Kpol_1031p44 [Vanderwaltozyma polyspora DSM 70294]EDO18138.1 hypothetical protein Kpol_1031p44 [Vanderwaltozyma polyspora DSM 70294]
MSSEADVFVEPDYIEPDTSSKNKKDKSSRPEINYSSGGTTAIPSGSIDAPIGTDGGIVADTTPLNRGTLDETVMETITRDLMDINSRLKQVVYPHFPTGDVLGGGSVTEVDNNDIISNNSDLWAPLTFIILYSLFVSHAKSLFSTLFVSCWVVLLVMALHLRLTKPYQTGSLISYISISGYCLFPQVIQSLLLQVILPLFLKLILKNKQNWQVRILGIFKLIILGLCLLWSVTSISYVTKSKGFVQVYPLALCLFGLAWVSAVL